MLLGASGGREDWTRPLPKGCRVRVPKVPLAVGDPAPMVPRAHPSLLPPNHRCKKRFYFFYFGYVFNVFYFPNVFFYFRKNVGKVQSGKQVNKKNNSNEIDL